MENTDETFIEKASRCFENENLIDGAKYLLKAYYESEKSKEILGYFDEIFFKPNLEELERIYNLNSGKIEKESNREMLEFKDLPYYVIPIAEEHFYLFDKSSNDIILENFTEEQIEIIELCTNENFDKEDELENINIIDNESLDFFDENVTIINTDDIEAPTVGDSIYKSRKNVYDKLIDKGSPIATIVIIAYNRLNKTKNCVEYVLKYTKDIDYELVLIDNGSSDGTFEYFKSVKYQYKKIVRITKNLGAPFPLLKYGNEKFNGKYIIWMPNDIYVTTNWLTNLLKCMESDDKIGWAAPMSSNVSNLQDPGLTFNSLEEMQKKAEIFNISNPLKWEKRLRLMNVVSIFKREILDLVGKFDAGFFHDFSEDDYCTRLRRMGYKLILCGDTFIHHDHDFRNLEGKDPVVYQKSLEAGRANFKEKYHGLDAWDDVLNFEKNLTIMLDKPKKDIKRFKILGVDVKCGTPILEIENHLIKNNYNKSVSSAFTTDAKYYSDLQSVCEGDVWCDRIEYIDRYIGKNEYDYIILGEPINKYENAIIVLDKVIKSTKKGAEILFKINNNDNLNNFLEKYGLNKRTDEVIYQELLLEFLVTHLNEIGITNIKISTERYEINENSIEQLKKIILKVKPRDEVEETLRKILIKEYLICIQKNIKSI